MAHGLSFERSLTTRTARIDAPAGSLAAAARDGRHDAQSDVDTAGDPALAGQEPRAAAQPAGGGARAQRIGAIGDGAEQDEQQAEPEDLRTGAAAREIDELRQERQEEQCG